MSAEHWWMLFFDALAAAIALALRQRAVRLSREDMAQRQRRMEALQEPEAD